MIASHSNWGFASTASEVVAGVDLGGQRAIVTGASGGIGLATARALASAGAEVTLAVRSVHAGEEAAASVRASHPSAALQVRRLDVSDLRSVGYFARQWSGPLHMLVNNAGVMAIPALTRTEQGYEMQWATNFLGHFALTRALHGALAAVGGARVVNVSSAGHLLSPVIFGDINFDFTRYDPLIAYGQSKSACNLAAVAFSAAWAADAIVVNAANPGAVPTNLQKHTGGLKTPPERRKTVDQGAATSVLLALPAACSWTPGRYFEDCREAIVVRERTADFTGVAAYACDRELAELLVARAARMIA
jgi:NAD(P)-dependent dehydrogenase (short-subunit alcohol dehydrogenase family)